MRNATVLGCVLAGWAGIGHVTAQSTLLVAFGLIALGSLTHRMRSYDPIAPRLAKYRAKPSTHIVRLPTRS
jgi:hypothetical protein